MGKKLLPVVVFMIIAVGAAGYLAYNVMGRVGLLEERPWDHLPRRQSHTDHTNLIKGPFGKPQDVTKSCLGCHPDAAKQLMATAHWNWIGDPVEVPGHKGKIRIGKKDVINNFCVGIEGNWPRCTTCHIGYGWKDASFDFSAPDNVDCLSCHDHSDKYEKGLSGMPAEGSDLLAAAKSVGVPRRANCGWCHFSGGGGDAVKHGDLDGTMTNPVEREDAHMGKYGLLCVDCHRTKDHNTRGRSMSVSVDSENSVSCTDCHSATPHGEDRLNAHTAALACQACHIPKMAVKTPTKVIWDWSTAGQDIGIDDPHEYLKIKGSFIYEKNIPPEYYWYNGLAERYIKGDKIIPGGVTHINYPMGGISDPGAKIWPFKVHRAKQIYDTEYNHLLIPKTVGEGGYWTDFDWNEAARLGSEAAGIPYSGHFGFTETDMYWPLSHMVAPKEYALQCTDCHGERGRMNWEALGYDGDPAYSGGRRSRGQLARAKGGAE